MSRSLSGRFVAALLVILLSLLLVPLAGIAQTATPSVTAEYVPPSHLFPNAVTWIGALEGSWKEMGFQYGQRAAQEIRNNTDREWMTSLSKLGDSAEKILRLSAAFEEQINLLCPEVLEFFAGMAEGAAPEMNKSVYVGQASNYMRILNLQWDMVADPRYLDLIGQPAAAEEPVEWLASLGMVEALEAEEDCNGFWVTGPATKDGLTYASRHSQGGSWETKSTNQVAFVIIPNDRSAAVTFVMCPAGEFGTGQILNEYGVYLGWGAAGAGKAPFDQWAALGVPNYIYNLPAVVYAKTAQDAVDYVVYGTERYRRLTGRTTLLRERSNVQMYCDPNEALVLEQAASKYAIRRPGYMGEIANSYIAWANHFYVTEGYFDGNHDFILGSALRDLVPEKEGNSSYYRFWTQMVWFQKNFGNITLDMLMHDLSAAHYAYDKAGTLLPEDPVTGLATAPGSVCVHSSFSEQWPKGIRGSFVVGLARLETREIWFVPAMPCEWKRHDWFYCDLKIYSRYRDAVYGY